MSPISGHGAIMQNQMEGETYAFRNFGKLATRN